MNARAAIRMLLAPNPSPMTLDGTRTYIVGVDRPVVIDPGPEDERHTAALIASLGGAAPEAILLTHGHPDHAGGAESLAERTGAPVRVGRGALAPVAAGERSAALGDGDEIRTDRGILRAIATPGHAPEHLAFHWTGRGAPAGGAVFVGDLMMGIGDTTLVAPPEGDLADYLRSLERVDRLRADTLYPTHGPPILEAAAAVERYRTHRRRRLDRLREALGHRPEADAVALLDAIYGASLDPALRAQAAGSIEAMLHYLARRR